VAESGEEFYAEVDPLPEDCSAFVSDTVVLQLTGPKLASAALVAQLAAWLRQFAKPVLTCDADWDIQVLRQLVEGRGAPHSGPLKFPGAAGLSVALTLLPAQAAAEDARFEAARAAFFAQEPRQHHALTDARALREAARACRDDVDAA
jgi:hypothetical protein